MTALLAACLVTLLLAVPGCGLARRAATARRLRRDRRPALPDATSPTDGGGDEAGGAAVAITAVTVRETGGLIGVDDSTTVTDDADRAGDGLRHGRHAPRARATTDPPRHPAAT